MTWSWDGPKTATENMALDEEELLRADSAARLRFYSWSGPAITLGYSQRMEEWLDLAQCRELGIQVARRPTGGGVVFHDGDLSWSLCLPQEALKGNSIRDSYRQIHQAVLTGLKKSFNLPIELASCQPMKSFPSLCFASPVGYDIMSRGRKLMGGAIRWQRDRLLYQGTLCLQRDLCLFEKILLPDRLPWLERLRERSITLQEVAGGEVQFLPLIEAILKGLERYNSMRCDTCSREVEEVKRVVIYKGYDRTRVRAIYNCTDCFEAKEKSKVYNRVVIEEPSLF